jgi:predicted AAA+ superfamily ATPase
MIKRWEENSIRASLEQFPTVALLGPRQVGKTTLAKQISETFPNSVYLDLENPEHLARLAEPTLYLRQFEDRLCILDEIQRIPELFPILRALIDENRIPGRFLLLG